MEMCIFVCCRNCGNCSYLHMGLPGIFVEKDSIRGFAVERKRERRKLPAWNFLVSPLLLELLVKLLLHLNERKKEKIP